MSEGNMEHGKVPGNAVARLQPARGNKLSLMDKKLNLLTEKVDKLLSFQEDLTGKLQKVNRGIDDIGKNIDKLTASQASTAQTDTTKRCLKPGDSIHPSETETVCSEMLKLMRATQQDALKHRERLEKIEKMVDTVDKVITFVGETFKNSKVVDFILRGTVPWKKGNLVEILMETNDKPEEKVAKPKHVPSNRGVQAKSKESLEEPKGEEKLDENNGACEKVNSFNAVVSKVDSSPQVKERTTQLQTIAGSGKTNSSKNCQPQKDTGIKTLIPNHGLPFINHGPVGNKNVIAEAIDKDRAPGLEEHYRKPINQKSKESENKPSTLSAISMEAVPSTSKSVSRGGCEVIRTRISINVQMTDTQEKIPVAKEGSLGDHGDDSPPPPAPFEHQVVSIKQTEITTCYSVCRHEVLGGGRFGQVHKCTEVSTGLNLAAKIIKVKGAKEREEVKNEINIMNQLNHVNLIQLYDAFECKNNLTLIMEYVEGGELFDRITDENYHLTELDAILFTKQICEGVHYIHQQYILHLDLKPENILCINRTGNQIKIIDFGLARRYKPREKLKVNFGTPEFLAPEVVNYDFVSFPTDMWSVGVITYMLLSGLSPFLGETDAETMNYIVNCSWDFDAEAFEDLSEEAKDFISKLLVKEKSCRMSAAQCLKHEWLNDLPGKAKKSKFCLKSQLLLRSYMAHRKWKKHFYVVAAANRLRRFPSMSVNLA
ncbi:myosin light chain kinase 3 isoform X4 [Malaclemys terrapin pileata]|uniref:myosin light chain kinase 3 isoform X4 n=1 Tax=Malaclemys terrapin pileata TaxID=2991368 RepID=UPI0023A894E2|nr:myosin light chain kinase 3 isoform X4 [Malaclemys terrapin pileata]